MEYLLLVVLLFIDLFKTPNPQDGNSATIRNFDKNDANRSRNDKSVVESLHDRLVREGSQRRSDFLKRLENCRTFVAASIRHTYMYVTRTP